MTEMELLNLQARHAAFRRQEIQYRFIIVVLMLLLLGVSGGFAIQRIYIARLQCQLDARLSRVEDRVSQVEARGPVLLAAPALDTSVNVTAALDDARRENTQTLIRAWIQNNAPYSEGVQLKAVPQSDGSEKWTVTAPDQSNLQVLTENRADIDASLFNRYHQHVPIFLQTTKEGMPERTLPSIGASETPVPTIEAPSSATGGHEFTEIPPVTVTP